ncbi:hypothetical protein DQ04_01291010 [Trypanosoma grayi]|uniref:hypothetical protein n=1 Tax=Trypanosoma grayi TaxID=71804 RepID=UPI0004F4422C|nr:hypothetical protein DQ04_01291010 [Trypanosoma grayi]KEG12971.1 hypothetical protein DQ04_01291010 [Trypanosoma grayi]
MSGLRREDERKLKELNDLCERVGRRNLPEDDQLCMLYLEDRYNHFLEEGMRKLRSECDFSRPKGIGQLFTGASKMNSSRRGHRERNIAPNSKNTTTGTRSGGVVKPVPAALEHSSAASSRETLGKLWTWVLEDVVVGGIPRAGPHEDGAGHLLELWRQCRARGGTALSVVSCLELDESIPHGFAVLKDWEQFTGTVDYYFVPFIPPEKQENPPEVVTAVLEELLTICSSVYNASHLLNGKDEDTCKGIACRKHSCPLLHIGGRKKGSFKNAGEHRIVYIMCKTGHTRAWVFSMAYLISQYGMEYNEADQFLRQLRAFEPSSAQVEFVLKFAEYAANPRRTRKPTEEEEMYHKVLAQVLSLPPSYRERLLCDLEELT